LCIEWLNSNAGFVSFITAIATAILAGGTLYYAWTNHKLWKSHEKQSIERHLLDEINYVILPIIDQCEGENRQIENKTFWDVHNEKISLKKIKISPIVDAVFTDFLKGRDELMSRIESHDIYIDDLISSSETAKLTMKQSGFNEKVNDFLQQFNEKYPDNRISDSNGSFPKFMLRHVLFNYSLKEKLLGGNYENFWREYGKELLKFRNVPALKPIIDQMENALEGITNENNLIIKELKEIYNQYISKHHLPLEEIEKKHRYKFVNVFEQ
jgi:hypothetical protein